MSLLRQASGAARPRSDQAGARSADLGRKYTGPSPWIFGLLIVLAARDPHLPRVREEAARGRAPATSCTRRSRTRRRCGRRSPVRIAGVNVGKVTEVEAERRRRRGHLHGRRGGPADPRGRRGRDPAAALPRGQLLPRPVARAARARPSSPTATQIPITQTATAVQLDEVLTALQAPTREGLQQRLTRLRHGAQLPADRRRRRRPRTPTSRASRAGESLNDAFRYGGRAGTRHRDRLRGPARREPRRPGRASSARPATVFAKLASREGDLGDLITNFNVIAGALATESANLSETIAELAPTLERGRDLARRPQRRAARRSGRSRSSLEPGIQELPATIDAFEPWLDQTDQLLERATSSAGSRKLLRSAAPGLAQATAGVAASCFPQTLDLSRCSTENLIPTGDAPITADSSWSTGQPNFNEFFYGARRPRRRRPGLRRQRPLPAHPARRRAGPGPRPEPDRPARATRSTSRTRSRRRTGSSRCSRLGPAVPHGRPLLTRTPSPTSTGPPPPSGPPDLTTP